MCGCNALLVAMVILAGMVSVPSQCPAQGEPATKKSPITVSKETTVVLGPIDEEGYVDVLEAVNQRMNNGVTPENNAVVPLIQALGAEIIPDEIREEYFRRLKIDAPPVPGDYFIDSVTFSDREGLKGASLANFQESLAQAQARPWKSTEHPTVAVWVKANQGPLDLIIRATKRKHYYAPLIAPDSSAADMFAAYLPMVSPSRNVATLLAVRAMLHAGEIRFEQASRDLLACHRLGRLTCQGHGLMNLKTGIAIDRIASRGDLAMAAMRRLPAEQARLHARQLAKLPSRRKVTTVLDRDERLAIVDAITSVARGPSTQSLSLPGNYQLQVRFPIDWDESLRVGHEWIDRFIHVLQQQDHQRRETLLGAFTREMRKEHQKQLQWNKHPLLLCTLALVDANTRRTLRGRQIGHITSIQVLPAAAGVQQSEFCSTAESDLAQIAFALSAYRTDHGRYPAELAALRDTYLKTIPLDPFSGKPLIYRGKEDGYLLYSLGPNRQDDRGINSEDSAADDLVVRVPLPEKATK